MRIPIVNTPATGVKINMLRQQKGMSVKDMQKIFGFATPQAIYKWIHGQNLPSTDNLVILANIFNTTIDDILSTDWVEIK